MWPLWHGAALSCLLHLVPLYALSWLGEIPNVGIWGQPSLLQCLCVAMHWDGQEGWARVFWGAVQVGHTLQPLVPLVQALGSQESTHMGGI